MTRRWLQALAAIITLLLGGASFATVAWLLLRIAEMGSASVGEAGAIAALSSLATEMLGHSRRVLSNLFPGPEIDVNPTHRTEGEG
jgi:hypothetical protein